MPYVDHRWLGGMLTNYRTVKKSIERLKTLEGMQQDGSLEKISKKEALLMTRELEKLNRGLIDRPVNRSDKAHFLSFYESMRRHGNTKIWPMRRAAC